MKRTLTAAATVVVSSAGVVGLAGTANAAESTPPSAGLPVDGTLAHATSHLTGALESATGVVGDVVPMEGSATGRPAAPGPRAPEQKVELAGTVNNLLGELGLAGQEPLGNLLPTEPRADEALASAQPVGDVVKAVPAAQDLAPDQLDGMLAEQSDAEQRTKPATQQAAPEQLINGVVQSLLSGGPLGQLGDLGSL